MKKYNGMYVLSCKLDGVSGLYSTEGPRPRLYTRGNGIIGQDISHLIPYLKLPKVRGISIRGEFIISKQKFKTKYSADFSNPRNFVAGIINSKTIDVDRIKDIDFVAYEVIHPQLKPSEQMEFLGSQAVDVVRHVTCNSISNDILSKLLVKWRDDYAYEIDGIICIHDEIYQRLQKILNMHLLLKWCCQNKLQKRK
jgi:NAD-dependent DNA ligase